MPSKPANSPVDSNDFASLDGVEDDNEGEPKEAITCVEQVVGKIRLYTNEYICSPDRRFLFGMSSDGDLSLLDQIAQPSTKLWSADTSKANSGGDAYAKLQKDGNLVVSTEESGLFVELASMSTIIPTIRTTNFSRATPTQVLSLLHHPLSMATPASIRSLAIR